MTFQVKKASRAQQKLRLGISGTAGSGKTWSALLLAESMEAKKICVLDTERGSASLYSDRFKFDVVEFQPPYSPQRYIEAINYISIQGYDLIILDSISPEWNGKGGALEIHSSIPGNSYVAWSKVTPLHQSFIEAILNAPCHVIVTMRAKTAYVLEENSQGKMVPKKKGMEPQQRDGFEFEMTSIFEMDQAHNYIASKDRTGLFISDIPQPLDKSVGERLLVWLGQGTEPAPEAEPIEPVITEKEVITALVARINSAQDIGEALALKADWITIQQDYPKLKKVTIDHVEKLFLQKESF